MGVSNSCGGATPVSQNPLWLLWGKSNRESGEIHPLVRHLLEAAAVCRMLLERRPCLRRQFAKLLGVAEDQVLEWVPFLCAQHDLGKAGPFQFCPHGPWGKCEQVPPAWQSFFPRSNAGHPSHGSYTTRYLQVLLPELLKKGVIGALDPSVVKRLASALGGHHGAFVCNSMISSLEKEIRADAGSSYPWLEVARRLLEIPLLWLRPSKPLVPVKGNAWPVLLAGVVSLSDWIASNEAFFPYRSLTDSLDLPNDLWETTLEHAGLILDKAGFREVVSPAPATFSELFAFDPRPLQRRMGELLPMERMVDPPRFLILEAPMGEGKTEAALFAMDRWQISLGRNGVYVAMPTTATSNQMYCRVERFQENRRPGGRENLHLLHGQALLSDDYDRLKARSVAPDEGETPSVQADEWFCAPKRGLLASGAVGTVDQALLGVLQTRYQYLRLFGLAGKTVIFDEVHGYDAYMLTEYENLLRWLAALNCTVVVLSATLPAATRRRMVQAFSEGMEAPVSLDVLDGVSYPRVTTLRDSGDLSCDTFPSARSFSCRIRWEHDRRSVAQSLAEEMKEEGGAVAWICNTVRSAQETYDLLREVFRDRGIDVMLFHARYQAGERRRRERAVLERFGPGRKGGDRVVLVATQVVEQSLDLDFDHMITELAPVDLILQRLGREHRHGGCARPQAFVEPWLRILVPEGLPDDFGASGKVYSPFVLLRTWLVLKDRASLALPGQMDDLMEAVYGEAGDFPEEYRSLLARWQEEHSKGEDGSRFKAASILIPDPGGRDVTQAFSQGVQEDEGVCPRARTRLSNEDRIPVVLLHRKGEVSYQDRSGTAPVSEIPPRDPEERRRWEKRMVELSVDLPTWFLRDVDRIPEPRWKGCALLRHHGLLLLEDGKVVLGEGRCLEVDEKKGVIRHFGSEKGGASRGRDV